MNDKKVFLCCLFCSWLVSMLPLYAQGQEIPQKAATSDNLPQRSFSYDAKGKRNPFIPLVGSDGRLIRLEKEEESKSDLSVEGIIFDKQGRSYALVNGSVAEIGDMIGEYQVLKILEDKVTFIKEGLTIDVRIKKEGE